MEAMAAAVWTVCSSRLGDRASPLPQQNEEKNVKDHTWIIKTLLMYVFFCHSHPFQF